VKNLGILGIFYTSLHLVSTHDLPIIVADLMRIDPLAGLVRCGQAKMRSLQDLSQAVSLAGIVAQLWFADPALESGNRLHGALNVELEMSGFFDNRILNQVHGSGALGIERGAMVRSPP
jgi:hypothetical protein